MEVVIQYDKYWTNTEHGEPADMWRYEPIKQSMEKPISDVDEGINIVVIVVVIIVYVIRIVVIVFILTSGVFRVAIRRGISGRIGFTHGWTS